MKNLVAWIYSVWVWLVRPQLMWTTVIVLIAAMLLVLRPSATEFQVRLVGLVLQWLGIGTVALGVRKTRQFFGQPGLHTLFRNWIDQFPRWRKEARTAAGATNMGALGAKGNSHSWALFDPKAPIEDQVLLLATNLENLNSEFRELHNQMDKELHNHRRSLEEEERARVSADANLQQRLEVAQTGGLHISLVGVIWLAIGILLSTVPLEIVQWRQ